MVPRFAAIFAFLLSPTVLQAAETWEILEASKLPIPSEVDYPNCVTHLAIRSLETGDEWHAAGYGIRDRKLTSLGQLATGDKVVGTVADVGPEGHRKEMQVDHITRLDLSWRWLTLQGDTAIAENVPTARERLARDQRLALDRMSLQNTLMAQIGPVTGGVTSEIFFYGDRRFYRADFWKKTEVEGGGIYQAIRQFHQLLEARGIHLILVPTPSTMTLFPDHATNLYYDPELHGPINSGIQSLSQQLRDDGAEVLDITTSLLAERFFEHEGNTYPIYRPNDTHWSGYAARRVAELLAERIEPAVGVTHFEERVEVVTLKSDIESILASKHPTRPQTVPPHQSPVWTVEPKTARARRWLDESLDFPDTRVHLIGDSFVDALSEWHGDLHSHLVRALDEPVQCVERYGGCGAILQDWIDQHLDQPPPEVVVFVFAERYAAFDTAWPPLVVP